MNHFLLAVAMRLIFRVSHGRAARSGDGLQAKDLQILSDLWTLQPSYHHDFTYLVTKIFIYLKLQVL